MTEHSNCARRINGTIAMADAIVQHCGTAGQVFYRDELQNLIDIHWTGNTRTGRIENVLTVLEVRGQVSIARALEKRNHTAAFLADDLYLIFDNSCDVSSDSSEAEEVIEDEKAPYVELSDWAALLANEELIANTIENATDEELGFETSVESEELIDTTTDEEWEFETLIENDNGVSPIVVNIKNLTFNIGK